MDRSSAPVVTDGPRSTASTAAILDWSRMGQFGEGLIWARNEEVSE